MLKRILAFAILSLFTVTAAFGQNTVNGAGASFPFPIYSSWAFDYEKNTKIKINYQSIGSGGGIKQISEGTVDFGASDDPLTTEQLRQAGLIQFPAVVGGIVPIINIDGVKEGQLHLTPKLVADIYHGKITKWNDPAIASLNSGLRLPDATISVVYRSDSSGTTAVYTNFLSQVSSEWKDEIGAGKTVNWPTGIGAKGNDGIAGNVKRMKNSIGYVEFAYAKQNNIPWIAIRNAAGKTVQPSLETFQNAAASAKWEQDKDYYLWLVNAPGDNTWPIAAATFILLRTDQPQANAAVAKFFDWCFRNGDKMAEELIYVPLPDNLKEDIIKYWAKHNINI